MRSLRTCIVSRGLFRSLRAAASELRTETEVRGRCGTPAEACSHAGCFLDRKPAEPCPLGCLEPHFGPSHLSFLHNTTLTCTA